MFYGMKHWILWLSTCHILYINGENLCKDELLKHVNVSTELQSDVLLPCNFNPTLLGSDKTADITVVWRQWNTTGHNLLEISLQGEAKFWDYKGGRIKTFPKITESGNFSIVLQNVQPYDLSLYRCRLFNASGCSIAYQELELQLELTGKNFLAENWPFIAGGGGGAVALILLVVTMCFIKRAPSNTSNEHIYANSRFEQRNAKVSSEMKQSSDQHAAQTKKKVYTSKPQNHHNIYVNSCVEAGEIYVNQPH